MNFSETNSAYENSERLIKNGVMGYPVAFPELAAFDKARRQLIQKVNEGVMHESWQECLRIFNIIHAKLARTPCRPCWLINEVLDIRGGSRILEKIKEKLPFVDYGVREVFHDLCSHLEGLSNLTKSPLLEPLCKTPSLEGRTLFILRDMRLWEEVKSCLSEILIGHEWEIVKPSSLRSQQHVDRLFLFDPVWYLCYRNEEYLLRAPVAGEVHLVACAHEFTGHFNLSLLGDSRRIGINGRKQAQPNEKPWDFEPIALGQRGRFHFKGSGESKIWESGKKVTAIPFRLGSARGTYFTKDSSVWVVTADCSGLSPICTGIIKTPVEDLEPGELVLMTTSGGGSMIPLVADMILHRSNQIRGLQLEWKKALLAQLEKNNIHTTSQTLKALGAQNASPLNLKNWCNPRSIGMENLDTDLRAVLQLIGMDANYEEIVAGIVALRRAHQSAGRQLQTKLRESLQGMDLSEAFRQGELEIRHGDGPAKTVFLVEERGEEEEIPEEWEGELRDIDE